MLNQLKMNVFLDKTNKLRAGLESSLPETIRNCNTLLLAKQSITSQYGIHNDMIYLKPTHKNIGKPITFDILFITGEYAGLTLNNVKPQIIINNQNFFLDNKYTFSINKIYDKIDAHIIPYKVKYYPEEYLNSLYHFQLGEYQSLPLHIDTIYSLYNEINEWDTITLASAKKWIDDLNGVEMSFLK